MRHAASLVTKFVSGRSFADYLADEMLHAAVEREFTIIGEALNRLHKIAPELTDQIPERRSIISFRNILVHGYDIIDDKVVWETIQLDLPKFVRRVEELLAVPRSS